GDSARGKGILRFDGWGPVFGLHGLATSLRSVSGAGSCQYPGQTDSSLATVWRWCGSPISQVTVAPVPRWTDSPTPPRRTTAMATCRICQRPWRSARPATGHLVGVPPPTARDSECEEIVSPRARTVWNKGPWAGEHDTEPEGRWDDRAECYRHL